LRLLHSVAQCRTTPQPLPPQAGAGLAAEEAKIAAAKLQVAQQAALGAPITQSRIQLDAGGKDLGVQSRIESLTFSDPPLPWAGNQSANVARASAEAAMR
jgi:hypothetical protein